MNDKLGFMLLGEGKKYTNNLEMVKEGTLCYFVISITKDKSIQQLHFQLILGCMVCLLKSLK